jgi:hypothetical protein
LPPRRRRARVDGDDAPRAGVGRGGAARAASSGSRRRNGGGSSSCGSSGAPPARLVSRWWLHLFLLVKVFFPVIVLAVVLVHPEVLVLPSGGERNGWTAGSRGHNELPTGVAAAVRDSLGKAASEEAAVSSAGVVIRCGSCCPAGSAASTHHAKEGDTRGGSHVFEDDDAWNVEVVQGFLGLL